jgi:hypothetical protein
MLALLLSVRIRTRVRVAPGAVRRRFRCLFLLRGADASVLPTTVSAATTAIAATSWVRRLRMSALSSIDIECWI